MKISHSMALFLTGVLLAPAVFSETIDSRDQQIRKGAREKQQLLQAGTQNTPAPGNPAPPALSKSLVATPRTALMPATPVVPVVAPKLTTPPVLSVNPVVQPVITPVAPPVLTLKPVTPPVITPIMPPVITVMPVLPVIAPPPVVLPPPPVVMIPPPPVIVIPPPPVVLIPPPVITTPIVYVPPPKVYTISDRRLKTNIQRIGTHRLGIGIYEFDYVWGVHATGVMAGEVREVMPEAVLLGDDGYDRVDYSKL